MSTMQFFLAMSMVDNFSLTRVGITSSLTTFISCYASLVRMLLCTCGLSLLLLALGLFQILCFC
jgi:hypothetical protein